MKVAVSVPQDVFAKGEQLVKATGRTRSDVYSSALREYVGRNSADVVTETLDRVIAEVGQEGHDFTDGAALRTLSSSDW